MMVMVVLGEARRGGRQRSPVAAHLGLQPRPRAGIHLHRAAYNRALTLVQKQSPLRSFSSIGDD